MRAQLLFSLVAIGCLRFSEEPARESSADDDVAVADASVIDAPADATIDAPVGAVRDGDAAPSLCASLGGFSVLQGAMSGLNARLVADCRLERFFRYLDASKLAHMTDCMARQLASILACKSPDGTRMKYPALDSRGLQCRDMLGAHRGMNIPPDAFDAMVEHELALLGAAGVSAPDLALVGDVLRSQRKDIVSAPDAGRSDACAPEASVADVSP